MGPQQRSPRIEKLSWGAIEVEGGERYKDAKLFPGGACIWDWDKTGTRHIPGIQIADVEELLRNGAAIVILSQGVHQLLQIPSATMHFLHEKGVTVHCLPTEHAAELYNQLCLEGQPVGALMHTTC